ncbi:MAG: hypothetical protein Q6367_001205 [Candidatus Freyarchaeota archaeon]
MYGRLLALGILISIPVVVSALYLIQMGSPSIVVPLLNLVPPQILVVSPLTISNGPNTVPIVTSFTLLLTLVSLICVALDFIIAGWYLPFIRFVRYTPGYNTFGNVKRGINSLLKGTKKDKEMLTLFAAVTIGFYLSFAFFFVVFVAKIFPNYLLLLPVIPLLLFSGLTYRPCKKYMENALRHYSPQEYRK